MVAKSVATEDASFVVGLIVMSCVFGSEALVGDRLSAKAGEINIDSLVSVLTTRSDEISN